MRGITLFDFDGTLYRGAESEEMYTIWGFPHFLHSNGEITDDDLRRVQDAFRCHRRKHTTRTQFAHEVISEYYSALIGKRTDVIDRWAERFWESGDRMFGYASELVSLMAQYTDLVLVSGSTLETVAPAVQWLGFSGRLYTSQGTSLGGYFTGGYSEFASREVKELLMRELPKHIPFDPKTSFAFGDSESDEPLFQVVAPENVFVIGKPANGIAKRAASRGWTVIQDEKAVMQLVKDRIESVFHDEG